MRRPTFRSSALLISVGISLLPVLAHAELLRNLKLGDRGEDVRELQALLNRDQATAVAQLGPGSPGQETDYFGPLTQNAVMRLQNAHAAEILTPLGLTAPTGIVGAQTRAYLQRSQQTTNASVSTPSSQATTTSPVSPRPTVASISPPIVTKSAMTLTITGTGFTSSGNTVIVSSESPTASTNVPSQDGRTLMFLFHFTAADALKKQLAPARASGTYPALAEAIAQNIQQRISPTGNAQIPVRLGVKNANGESVPVQFLIDITEILKEIGSTAP